MYQLPFLVLSVLVVAPASVAAAEVVTERYSTTVFAGCSIRYTYELDGDAPYGLFANDKEALAQLLFSVDSESRDPLTAVAQSEDGTAPVAKTTMNKVNALLAQQFITTSGINLRIRDADYRCSRGNLRTLEADRAAKKQRIDRAISFYLDPDVVLQERGLGLLNEETKAADRAALPEAVRLKVAEMAYGRYQRQVATWTSQIARQGFPFDDLDLMFELGDMRALAAYMRCIEQCRSRARTRAARRIGVAGSRANQYVVRLLELLEADDFAPDHIRDMRGKEALDNETELELTVMQSVVQIGRRSVLPDLERIARGRDERRAAIALRALDALAAPQGQ